MSDARGISRQTAQRLGVALRKSEADTGAPVAQSDFKNQSQQMFRVKIDQGETVSFDSPGVGILQIQRSDGGDWEDTPTKIPNIYLGSDDQSSLTEDDICWIISRRNRWYVIGNNSNNSIPGGECACCPGCACYPADPDDITNACAVLPCLLKNYNIVGNFPWTNDGALAHDATCVFLSSTFNITVCEGTPAEEDLGDHSWELTADDDIHGSELRLTGDTLDLLYVSTGFFHPFCGNEFILKPTCDIPTNLLHLIPRKVCVNPVGAACEPCEVPTIQACCAEETPLTLTGTLSDNLNSTGFTGSFTLTHDPSRLPAFGGSWYGTITTCGGAVTYEFQLTCCTAVSGTDTFDWRLQWSSDSGNCGTSTIVTTGPICTGLPPETGATCQPLNIQFLIGFGSFCACNNSGGAVPGNGYLTITE